MNLPIVFAIALNVQAALQAIATGDGYNFDVKATSVVVDPTELVGVPSTETPYTVVGEPEPVNRDFATSRPVAIKDSFTIRLSTRVDAPGTDKSRKTLAAWSWVADVETMLAKDPQRSGLALYTYVQQPTIYYGLSTQNIVYVELPVLITLQRAYGQPMVTV